MISAFDTYSWEEQQTLADIDGVFLTHASMWKLRWSDLYIVADHVECGPRRWRMAQFPGPTWTTEMFSPSFGNLDSLLVWAKLEGLL